jgi:hypothetical protein
MNRGISLALLPGLVLLVACEGEQASNTTTADAGTRPVGGETAAGSPTPGVVNSDTPAPEGSDDNAPNASSSPEGSGGRDGAATNSSARPAVQEGAAANGSVPDANGTADSGAGAALAVDRAASGGSGGAGGSGFGGGAVGGAVDAGGGAPLAPESPPGEWQEAFPSFTRHPIADFQSGYFNVTFDVDRDGLLDVVALSSGSSGLSWFKNPTWEEFAIRADTERFICMAPYDVDGDGDTDLAVASEFSLDATAGGGTVYWAEAPADPTTTSEWPIHAIDAVPTSHRLRWGDIDGDGRKELLNLPIFGLGSSSPMYIGAVQLKAYTIPSDPTGTWNAQVLDDALLEVAHGTNFVDWDGDAAEDILTAANAGVHLFQPSLGTPPRHLGIGHEGPRPDRGSSEVNLGSLGGARFIATIEPWHGTDAVVYTPGASETELWTRRVLGTDFARGHALATADLNGDGYDEIIGGDQGGGGALLIYRYLPSSDLWEMIEVDSGDVAVIGLDVQDINGDGALDIVAIGGATNNLVWYESSQ